MHRAKTKPAARKGRGIGKVEDRFAVADELRVAVGRGAQLDLVPMVGLEQQLRGAPVVPRVERTSARAVVAAESRRRVVVAAVPDVIGEQRIVGCELSVALMTRRKEVGASRIARHPEAIEVRHAAARKHARFVTNHHRSGQPRLEPHRATARIVDREPTVLRGHGTARLLFDDPAVKFGREAGSSERTRHEARGKPLHGGMHANGTAHCHFNFF